jgi:hypothetical protein
MTERDQRLLVFHGAIILMAGNLVGIPMANAITSGAGEDVIRAWRVAHTGLASGGVLMLAVAAVLRHVVLGPTAGRWLLWSFVVVGYAALVGLGLGAAGGVRGLEPTGSAMNLVAFAGNTVLGGASLLGTALLIRGAWAAVAAAP